MLEEKLPKKVQFLFKKILSFYVCLSSFGAGILFMECFMCGTVQTTGTGRRWQQVPAGCDGIRPAAPCSIFYLRFRAVSRYGNGSCTGNM